MAQMFVEIRDENNDVEEGGLVCSEAGAERWFKERGLDVKNAVSHFAPAYYVKPVCYTFYRKADDRELPQAARKMWS